MTFEGETAAALAAYTHNNPVRASVVRDPADSSWSSHRDYLSLFSATGGQRTNGMHFQEPEGILYPALAPAKSAPDRSVEHIAQVFRDVCATDVEPDGMVCDAGSVVSSPIKEDADDHGVRVRFLGTLERARTPMQVDIGCGDRLVPVPEAIDFPTILDFPAPRLRGYRRETVIVQAGYGVIHTRAWPWALASGTARAAVAEGTDTAWRWPRR